MWIKKLFKLILFFISGASSIIFLILFASYLYLHNNNSIFIKDHDKYLSNLISWYFDIDIKFDNIKVSKNKFNEKYKIEISKFEFHKFKQITNANIKNITFNCDYLTCITGYRNYENINLLDPYIEIKYMDKDNTNIINPKLLINLINQSNIATVVNGTIKLISSDTVDEIKNINILSKDSNINGKFRYKFESERFTEINFTAFKSFNETELSLVFSELNLKHFNIESYVLLPIKTNDIKISGSINLFIENNEFKNIHFNIASKIGDIKFTEKYINSYLMQENLYYENFLLSGNYDFQTKILKYENLKFDIHNDQGSIIYALIDGYADKKLTNFLNIKIDFLNYHLGSLSLFNNKDLNNLLVNEYSGSASFKLVDDKIIDINIFIKDLSLRNLNIIDLSFKSQNLQSEKYLNFSLNGNLNELTTVIEDLNLIDIKENLNSDGVINTNFNIIIPSDYSLINKYKYSIDGIIKDIHFNALNDKYIIDYKNINTLIFNFNNYDNGIFNINKFRLVFDDELNENKFIEYAGKAKFINKQYSLSGVFNFNNLNITNLDVHIPQIDDALSLLVSGTANIDIDNSILTKFSAVIEDFYIDSIEISNLNIIYNAKNNITKLIFSSAGELINIKSFVKNFDIANEYKSLNLNQFSGLFNLKNEIELSDFKILNFNMSGSISNFSKINKSNFYEPININSIKEITFNMDYNNEDITISGNASLLNRNLQFKYINNYELEKLLINYIVDNNVRKLLKLDNYIINGESEYSLEVNRSLLHWDLILNIDYSNSNISIPHINYNKINGVNSDLIISAKVNKDFLFNDIKFQYNDSINFFEGFISEFTKENIFINFSKFLYDKNNLVAYVNFVFNKYINIDIESGILNLDTFKNGNKTNDIDLFINANLKKFIIDSNISLDNTNLKYVRESGKLKELSIKGKYYGEEDLVFLSAVDSKNKSRNFYSLSATDAGKFFKILDYKTEIKGGLFSSEGFYGDLDEDNDIMGTISIDEFKIMKTPFFAELLLAASLTGLIELLENDGIEFEQFDAQFFGKNNIYNIVKSRAYGFSLGLTGEGIVNTNNNSLDIKGALIPAYKINSVFNNIPIIGEIIVGKEDEGLFAINYNTSGNWNDLKSEINPISALTPGLLRNIFDFLE